MTLATTLRVVILDTEAAYIAVVHENNSAPYRKRLVTINLTPEQVAELVPRSEYERLGDVWLESEGEWTLPDGWEWRRNDCGHWFALDGKSSAWVPVYRSDGPESDLEREAVRQIVIRRNREEPVR